MRSNKIQLCTEQLLEVLQKNQEAFSLGFCVWRALEDHCQFGPCKGAEGLHVLGAKAVLHGMSSHFETLTSYWLARIRKEDPFLLTYNLSADY
jgi:hypothetical protein